MFKKILRQLKQEGIRKLAVNSVWLTFDNVLRIIAGFLIGVWVARYLGPDDYGRWNYALSYVSLFAVLIGSALNNVVVRELVKFPQNKYRILGSSLALKLIGGVIALVLSVGSIYLFSHQNSTIKLMTAIVAIGTVFQAFEVVSYWFESKIKSSFGVVARTTAFAVANLLKIIFVLAGFSVIWFAVASAVELIICAVAYIAVYRISRENITAWKYDGKTARQILLSGIPLILTGVIGIAYSRMDKIFVGSLISQGALGNYSVGTLLTESWSFVAIAVTVSVYPSIIFTKLNNAKLYESRMRKLYSLMVIMALLISIPISVFSHPIINFLYGARFNQAAGVLSIYVWSIIPLFLDVASQKWFYAENLQKYMPVKALIGSVISIVFDIIFIPKYGITAAAIISVISTTIATYFSNAIFKQTRPLFIAQTMAIIKPNIFSI